MIELLKIEFGFESVEIKKLVGYENLNYLVKTERGRFIFKTYNYDEDLYDLVNAEIDILSSLSENSSGGKYPEPIAFTDGSKSKILDVKGAKCICRMLSFLDGQFLGDAEHTEPLFKSFGTFLAKTNLSLRKLKSHTIKSRQWEWDLQYLYLNKKYVKDIPRAKDRSIINYFFLQFEEVVRPIIPELRKQIIHNDANDWNTLTKGDTVSGIIDFGDLAYSPLINEVAIAIAYACFDKKDPIKWASIIIKSYHKTLPLESKEIKILYYLVAARLVMSICNAAHSKKINPDNAYTSISEISAWKMLYQWLTISPIYAENQFRLALGLPIEGYTPINDVIKKRHKHLSPILSISYKQPIHMVKSAFQYMYDAEGDTFLDAYNNIPHVGHSHPKVVEAGQRQMAKLNTNTRYLFDQLSDYAEKLLAKFPSSLSKVYFVNSGSAASDLAIRMAKMHTGLDSLMVMEHGYHGNTQTAINISDYKFSNPRGTGQNNNIIKTQIPDTYRGKYTDSNNAGRKYAQDAILQMTNHDNSIAAFITEPIVGCGGQVPLADGYLEALYPAIRAQSGVCISDEVQTGFGRLGAHFWGYEAQNVVPDIIIIGKPMANGHPMGAVICTDDIAESFGKGVEFFSSFGGNPVSCAIASAVLDVIEEEGLQGNAKVVGDYYMSLLRDLQKRFKCLGDVRGSGLFIGVEIVKKDSIEADPKLASHIKNELRTRHILISTDGPHDSVLKTKPPLCFTTENAKTVVDNIEDILTTYNS